MYYSKPTTEKQQKKIRIPAATFLHKVTDPYIYGIKRAGIPQAFASQARLTGRLNERGYGYQWNNASFLEHCQGNKTLYYFSRFQVHLEDRGDDELLPELCIMQYWDIDIAKSKGIGTIDNAKAAVAFLENYFPGLYSEDGRRAFPLVYNDGYGLAEYKAIIKKFEKVFHELLTKHCGIEKFEIKGMPTSIYKDKGCWKVDNYGTLGKLPTQLLSRFDEFYSQRVIRVSELEALVAEAEVKVPTATPGSTTNIILNEDQLEQIPEVLKSYKQESYRCMALRQADPSGRRNITALDFQIGLLVLSACNLKPNENGQLPGNRIKAIWTYLFENGLVARGFDNSRWKVIRDTMVDCGYIEMIDNTYSFNKDGTKGKAMQWSLKEEFSSDFKQHTRIYSGTIPAYVFERFRPKLLFKAIEPDFNLREAEKAIESMFLAREMEEFV